MAVKKNVENTQPVFSKEQILKSKKYAAKKDVLVVVLDNDKTYTHGEIENEINNFLKQEFDKKEVVN